MKVTTKTILQLKGQSPIVALTAYDALGAALADRAGIDLILVGDSVGTTILGFETTVPVTLDMMVHHTAGLCSSRTCLFPKLIAAATGCSKPAGA